MFKRAKKKVASSVEKKIDSIFPAICLAALIFGLACATDVKPNQATNYIIIKELKL